jgi:non-homologous end joining protein Ku
MRARQGDAREPRAASAPRAPRDRLVDVQLRSADEVRTAEFAIADTGAIDPDMLAIAETIIERAKGKFDPADFRDGYQDALRALVDDKLKGVSTKPRTVADPPKIIDLMEALKRSLLETGAVRSPAKAKRPKPVDRRQPQILMPVGGGKEKKPAAATKPATAAPISRRKKAG